MKRSDGEGYIDVPYIADAILVNLGSLMQQWTSDSYLATVRLDNNRSVSIVTVLGRYMFMPFVSC